MRFKLLILMMFGFCATAFAQRDYCAKKALNYLSDAQQYLKKEENYDREAEYYNDKAINYLRKADYYACRGDYDRAETYAKWASDAADRAVTEAKWANNARDYLRWANEAWGKVK